MNDHFYLKLFKMNDSHLLNYGYDHSYDSVMVMI